jgi:hypothetical protein
MPSTVPYEDYVGSSDPLLLLASTPERIVDLVQTWDEKRWATPYAPGAWTGAQVVLHLAHDEIGWSHRIRMAAILDDYTVQAYDGAQWVILESPTDHRLALNSFLSLRRLNLILFKRIDSNRRTLPIHHPEFGEITIDWILRVLAGHDLHHLRHLQMIASL